MKRMLAGLMLVSLAVVCPPKAVKAQEKGGLTLRDMMSRMEAGKGVNFIYESSVKVNTPYNGKGLDSLPLKDALRELFNGTGISWKIKGKYVMLHKPQKPVTMNGYVYQKNGEPLINATLFEPVSSQGTLTNAYGYYSLTLPEGSYLIGVSYVGFKDTTLVVNFGRDLTKNIYLENQLPLQEVVVESDLNSQINTTQTGKISLGRKELNTEFALLSSPDLVKSLQRQPGVNSGTELISGLYVHGGDNDGNLFLLDGNPIYQVNHLGGIFSAFNTDIIKTVDFYKSGFPGRYGGRLSSVVDVRTNDGDMKEFHGSFSIGLLDGRIQMEGPIVRDKTSFNIAMRRSWADLITAPYFAINNILQDDHLNGRYSFQDINAKLTHRFSDRSRLYLSFYSGNDFMKLSSRTNSSRLSESEYGVSRFKLNWGNTTTSLNWNYVFSPKLFSNLTAVYSRNTSGFSNRNSEHYTKEESETGVIYAEDRSRSVIDDIGYRMEFDLRPSTLHHIRFGSNYLHHAFRPQNNYSKNFTGTDEVKPDTLEQNASHFYGGNEFTLYAEDDIAVLPGWKVNLGVHYTLFNIEGKTYHSVEPRLATQIRLNKDMSVKFSYTEMSQFVHQLSNTYLNLPTDYWVPSTRRVRPMRSRQVAAGLYGRITRQLQFSAEGYYKSMNRLLEYNGGYSLTPSVDNWESLVQSGKGRAYGAELSLAYSGRRTSADVAYTLSWSERKFPSFNINQWYPDHYDNRHKLNITTRHKFTKRIEGYAAWTFHTGDRTSIPTQRVENPSFPGVEPSNQLWMWVYEKPNNQVLPAYHRLDLGVNFRKFTKRGHERIWNVSLYNAYCRLNPLYTEVEKKDNRFVGKAIGVFPIIPSFSYTLKF